MAANLQKIRTLSLMKIFSGFYKKVYLFLHFTFIFVRFFYANLFWRFDLGRKLEKGLDICFQTHLEPSQTSMMMLFCENDSHPSITCSKLTIETLEQGVKFFKVNTKHTRTTPMASFWCLYCYFGHILHLVLVFLLLTLSR